MSVRYDQQVVMLLDSAEQRLATLYAESDSQPEREFLASQVDYVRMVTDRYINSAKVRNVQEER